MVHVIEKGTDYIELAAALMTVGEGLYKLGKWLEERKTEKEPKEKSEKKKPRSRKRRKRK